MAEHEQHEDDRVRHPRNAEATRKQVLRRVDAHEDDCDEVILPR
jgi:hypothetical protein